MLGLTHPATAESLNHLAGLLDSQGDYAAARPLYERAVQIFEQVLGLTHPDTAASLNNLAALHAYQDDFDRAIPLIERALAIREQALGPSHPATAESLNNLAALHAYQDDFDRAIPLIERALAIRVRVLGTQHPDTIQTQRNLETIRAAVTEQHDQTADPLAAFAPLLTAIAAVTTGANAQRPVVEAALADLETRGWHLSAPAQRIWQGERDPAALTTGLDEQDSALVHRILELVRAGEP